MSYSITFKYKEKKVPKTKQYNKPRNYLMKTLLEEFLKDTNSKQTLNKEIIAFTYSGRLINSETYLENNPNLNILQIFKQNYNPEVTVEDTGNVIGGNHIIKSV